MYVIVKSMQQWRCFTVKIPMRSKFRQKFNRIDRLFQTSPLFSNVTEDRSDSGIIKIDELELLLSNNMSWAWTINKWK